MFFDDDWQRRYEREALAARLPWWSMRWPEPVRQAVKQLRRDFPDHDVLYDAGRWSADIPGVGRVDESNFPALRLRLETAR